MEGLADWNLPGLILPALVAVAMRFRFGTCMLALMAALSASSAVADHDPVQETEYEASRTGPVGTYGGGFEDGINGDGTNWIRLPYDTLPFLAVSAQGASTRMTVSVVSDEAAYTNHLEMLDPEGHDLFDCEDGQSTSFDVQNGGTVVWKITNQDGEFLSKERHEESSDRLNHYRAYKDADNNNQPGTDQKFLYRFEDKYNLGDHDYNDCVFELVVHLS